MTESLVPGRLLSCPECAKLGKKQILGKMLNTGDLLVLRFHHGTTILRSNDYNIVCGCGFIFSVSGTVITEHYQTL